jgi:DNA-3-methyladenine glycosylase I
MTSPARAETFPPQEPGGPGEERSRCGWAGSAPEYIAYHDEEWGTPLHGDTPLFERLSLEAFQSGLSWITILRKRPAFRRAFADFDIHAVAAFTEDDVERLLGDAGIVRNRSKIMATIGNARAAVDLADGLDATLWSFAPEPRTRPLTADVVPARTDESSAMARALKRHGFRFVGPTTAYALMQATGMVNDHAVGCWRAPAAG